MARLPPLNWLRAFEASARFLSFTAAAEELSMTQSAVSQQIKSLESTMGRALFLRRARGLELTDEGRGYLPTVQAAFAMLEEGTTVLHGRNDPDVLELQVNLSFALFWLTPRLGQFMDEHPTVQLNLATSVWTEERPTHPSAMQIVFGLGKREGMTGRRLTRDSIFPVCSPKLAKQIKTLDDLRAQRLFDLPGHGVKTTGRSDHPTARHGLLPRGPRWLRSPGRPPSSARPPPAPPRAAAFSAVARA